MSDGNDNAGGTGAEGDTSQTSAAAGAAGAEGGKGAADAGKTADAGATSFVNAAAAEATKAEKDKAAAAGKAVEAGKAGEKGKSQTSADFELKSPKGHTFGKDQLGKFGSWAKEKGFNAEQAQAAVDFLGEQNASEQKAFESRVAEQDKKNLAAIENDKELGGANLAQTKLLVSKAAAKYFPEGSAFAQMLAQTRLGNNPEVVRVIAAIGRDMAEDTSARGSSRTRAAASKSPIPYPSMEKEQ